MLLFELSFYLKHAFIHDFTVRTQPTIGTRKRAFTNLKSQSGATESDMKMKLYRIMYSKSYFRPLMTF